MIFHRHFTSEQYRKRLRFAYTNWRGDRHWYVVVPESVALDHYTREGQHEQAPLTFVLHAHVVTRDDEPKPGRRTFLIEGLRHIEEVDPPQEGGQQPHTKEMSHEWWS